MWVGSLRRPRATPYRALPSVVVTDEPRPLPATLASDLRQLPCSDPEYFFWHLGDSGQQLQRRTIVNYYWRRLTRTFREAGVQMTTHSFRHYFITQQLARGISVDDVSKMVGTSPKEIRHTYWHWVREDDERMDAIQSSNWLKEGLEADEGSETDGSKPAIQ